MINQLLGSSEVERRKNKKIIDSRLTQQPSAKSFKKPLHSTEGTQRESQIQSDMPISLVTPLKKKIDIKGMDVSIWDIQTSVKSRLKQKQIFLPQIDHIPTYTRSLPKSKPFSKDPLSHQSKEGTKKIRVKTTGNDSEDPQQTDYRYDQTIIEINELNDKFNRQNRRKQHGRMLYRSNNSNILSDEGRLRKKRFDHISRQEEFQRYVDYLENMYNRKHGKTIDDDLKVQERLMARVQTKKKSRNNDNKQDGNPEKERNSLKVKSSKTDEVQKPQKTDKGQAKASSNNQRNHAHDNFIQILRKAKNRGESLLIKLKKYPSQKVIK